MSFIRKLKSYFIPHEDNNHAPHFLRTKSIVVVIGILVLVEGAFLVDRYALLPDSNFFALISSNVIVSKTNDSRVGDNLQTLTVSPVLEVAARLKAEDMAAKGYFAHTSPEGVSPWFWFKAAGYKFAYAGENLAINFSDSEDLVNAWLNSPAHRANILNGRFTEIGIATAKGMYNGRETVFVVQMFGKPVSTPVVSAIAQTKPVVVPTPILTEAPAQTFVAIQGVEAEEPQAKEEDNSPVAAVPASDISLIQEVAASPRAASNRIFYVLGILMMVALALKVFVKFRVQHPRLIANAFAVLILIAAFVVLNEYISLSFTKVL